ncbi:hypothetical protein, partial [Pseudomonas helleri]
PWRCGMMLRLQFNNRVALSSCNRPVKADYDRLWGLLVLFLGTSASAVALIGGWFLKDVLKKNEKTPVAKS